MSEQALAETEPEGASETEPPKEGWNFFSEETTKSERRRYTIHAVIFAVGLVLVVWPFLPLVNTVEPYVLGMPFVMFWTAMSLVLVFVNTALLYRWEHGALTKP